MNAKNDKLTLSDIRFVKDVVIGSINPNNPIADEAREEQVAVLNRCLEDYPKGVILGSDITIGRYMLGQHELTMQKTTYHIGFARKPVWLPSGERSARFGMQEPVPGVRGKESAT